MNKDQKRLFKDVRENYNSKLSAELFKLLEEKGIPINQVIQTINSKYGTKFNSGNAHAYKTYPNRNIPYIFLWEACKLLEVSIDELFFSVFADTEMECDATSDSCKSEPESHHCTLNLELPGSESLITGPGARIFHGYYATYFTYFTPTHSNRKEVLKGKLTLSNETEGVHAHFELETGVRSSKDVSVKKYYDGWLVYSNSVRCCYCLLASNKIGELCFLMFRHFCLNDHPLDCRIAMAMTASAGGEDTNPTVHRMLLSRSEIKDEDLTRILPLLKLNSSDIIISSEELDQLTKENEEYKTVIQHILNTPGIEPETYYNIKENTVRAVLSSVKHASEKQAVPLISDMRERAVSYRYNKISYKADKTIRDYLIQLGYYEQDE